MTHYKSFRGPEIRQKVSYHLKAMDAENQLQAFTPRYGHSRPERPLSGSGDENTHAQAYHHSGRGVKKDGSYKT